MTGRVSRAINDARSLSSSDPGGACRYGVLGVRLNPKSVSDGIGRSGPVCGLALTAGPGSADRVSASPGRVAALVGLGLDVG